MNSSSIKPLDPVCKDLLEAVNGLAAGISPEQLTPAKRRDLMHAQQTLLIRPHPSQACARRDLSVGLSGRSLHARMYTPAKCSDELLVFFHGGGWVVGDLGTHDHLCALIANTLGVRLLSVEYRKAPEHRFPAANEDAIEALAWVYAHRAQWGIEALSVGGDSAGAHLAALAMHANAQVPIRAALLFYPAADTDFSLPSYNGEGAAGPGLTAAGMKWYWEQYLGADVGSKDWDAARFQTASVKLCQQRWNRPVPRTVVSVAAHDPLRDEGVAYAAFLESQGAQITLLEEGAMAHGFARQALAAEAAMAAVMRALAAFGSKP